MLEEFDYESFDANPMEPRAAPIELTDEQYAEYCKYLDPVRLFQNEFPLLSTVEDLKKLEPVTAFSVWMQGKSRHHPGECDADAEPWKKRVADWRATSCWPARDTSRLRTGWARSCRGAPIRERAPDYLREAAGAASSPSSSRRTMGTGG